MANSAFFNFRRNAGSDWISLTEVGREFQALDAAAGNARSPNSRYNNRTDNSRTIPKIFPDKMNSITFPRLLEISSRFPSLLPATDFFRVSRKVANMNKNGKSGVLQRSAGAPLLFVPRVRTQLAQRAFSVAGPTVFNSLSPKIRLSHSVDTFKRHLKTHLFYDV